MHAGRRVPCIELTLTPTPNEALVNLLLQSVLCLRLLLFRTIMLHRAFLLIRRLNL